MKKGFYAVLAIFVVAATMVVLLSGCGSTEKTNQVSVKEATAAKVKQKLKQMEAQRPDIFKGDQGQKAKDTYTKLLEKQVKQTVLLQREAEKRGIAVSDKEIKRAVDQVRQAYGSENKFEAALKKQGLTIESYSSNIKDQLIQSKLLAEITKDIKVSDAEVRAYYNTNKEMFSNQPFAEVSKVVKERVLQQKQRAATEDFYERLAKNDR